MSILFDWVNSKVNKLQLSTSKRLNSVEENLQTINALNINAEEKVEVESYAQVNSLPKNAANGHLSASVLGRTLTNSVTNGDFSDGVASILTDGADISVLDSVLSVNATGPLSRIIFTGLDVLAGSKWFFKIPKLDGLNESYVNSLALTTADGIQLVETMKFITDYEKDLYTIFTPTLNANGLRINLSLNDYSSDTDYTIDGNAGVFAINMTAVGIEDYTEEQMLQITRNGYIDGTKSVLPQRIKSVGKNLFDKSKAIDGYFISSNGDLTQMEGAFLTGLISCRPNTAYYGNRGSTTNWNFYDRNKNFIAVSETATLNPTTLSNAHYIQTYSTTATKDKDSLQIEQGTTATDYEEYKESTAYIPLPSAMDGLKSLPNGVQDEIDVNEGKVTQRIGTELANSIISVGHGANVDLIKINALNFKELTGNDSFSPTISAMRVCSSTKIYSLFNAAWDDATKIGQLYIDLSGVYAVVSIGAGFIDFPTSIAYQLATPITHQVETVGSLYSYPSGTLICESVHGDIDFYGDGIAIEGSTFSSIDRVTKVDLESGIEEDITSTCTLNDAKNGFTSTALSAGDLCWYELYYAESTQPLLEYGYYDSRYVLIDSVTSKAYKVVNTVADGVLSTTLEEV